MTQVAFTSSPVATEADTLLSARTFIPTPIRWGAIVAGAVTAIACQFFFTVLGVAIGISASDAASTVDAESVTMAAGAWWLISGTVSLLIGGLVLGMLATLPKGYALSLNAVAVWAATAIFGFAVLWSGAGMAGNAAMYGTAAGLSGNATSNLRYGSGPSLTDTRGTVITEDEIRAAQVRAAKFTRSAA